MNPTGWVSAGDTLTDTTTVNVNEGSTCGPAPSITAVGGSFTTGSVSSATGYVNVTDEDGTDVTAATALSISGATGTGGDGYYDTCESGSVLISAEYDHPEVAGTVVDTARVRVFLPIDVCS